MKFAALGHKIQEECPNMMILKGYNKIQIDKYHIRIQVEYDKNEWIFIAASGCNIFTGYNMSEQ